MYSILCVNTSKYSMKLMRCWFVANFSLVYLK